MLNKFLAVMVLSVIPFLAGAQTADDFISGPVLGTTGEMMVNPEAIVMKDKNGNENLVIFYQSMTEDGPVAAFTVATGAYSSGLDFDGNAHEYILKSYVMSADNFAPVPVLFDGKLYLFGSQNTAYGQAIPYNYFDSFEDLIAHTIHGEGTKASRYFVHDGSSKHNKISVINTDPNGTNDSIVVALYYQHSQSSFGFMRCLNMGMTTPDVEDPNQLSCKGQNYYGDSSTYVDPVHFTHITQGKTISLVRSSEDVLAFQTFNVYGPASEWNQSWDYNFQLNGANNTPKVPLSGQPIGSVEANGVLHVYFKKNDEDKISKTTVSSAVIYDPNSWNTPYVVKDGDAEFKTKSGVKTIIYKDRIYVLYADNETKTLRYFSDVVVN